MSIVPVYVSRSLKNETMVWRLHLEVTRRVFLSVASSLKNETEATSIVSLYIESLLKNEIEAMSIVFLSVASSLKNETEIWD